MVEAEAENFAENESKHNRLEAEVEWWRGNDSKRGGFGGALTNRRLEGEVLNFLFHWWS